MNATSVEILPLDEREREREERCMREERKERRGSEKKREENKSESGEGEKRMECARERRESRGPLSSLSLSFSPSLSSRSAVIYRPEPSPSLTPLLRNYTQSVANKSKKVLAVFVRIHETCAVPSAPRPILPLLLSRPPPPSTTLFLPPVFEVCTS